jgi:hypothetical protein
MKIGLKSAALLFAMSGLSVHAHGASDVNAMSAVVFAQVKGLPDGFKQAISEQLLAKKWQVKDGKLADAKCGVVPHDTNLVDLNHDGVNEVMLLLGNACTSGNIGGTVYLFTPEADNKTQRQLGFAATGFKVYKRDGEVWDDLLFTGTGDCQPVWRYKNGRYNFHHLFEAKPNGCAVPAGHAGGN